MKVNESIDVMFDILKARPKYILGGSLGLIVQGAILTREVHDLDFAVNVPGSLSMSEMELGRLIQSCSLDISYLQCSKPDYNCYKVTSDRRSSKMFNSPFYYNVFIREQTDTIPISIKGITVIVQHANEIFKYKEIWRRPKDLKDIESRDLI